MVAGNFVGDGDHVYGGLVVIGGVFKKRTYFSVFARSSHAHEEPLLGWCLGTLFNHRNVQGSTVTILVTRVINQYFDVGKIHSYENRRHQVDSTRREEHFGSGLIVLQRFNKKL